MAHMTARGSFKAKEALKRKSKAEHMAISIFKHQKHSWTRTIVFTANPSIQLNRSIHNSINLCKQDEQSYGNMSNHDISTDIVFSANIQYCKQIRHRTYFLTLVYVSLCTRYIVYPKGLRTLPLVWCCFKKTMHNAHLVLALFFARVWGVLFCMTLRQSPHFPTYCACWIRVVGSF